MTVPPLATMNAEQGGFQPAWRVVTGHCSSSIYDEGFSTVWSGPTWVRRVDVGRTIGQNVGAWRTASTIARRAWFECGRPHRGRGAPERWACKSARTPDAGEPDGVTGRNLSRVHIDLNGQGLARRRSMAVFGRANRRWYRLNPASSGRSSVS